MKKGFTLTEMLVVILIIAILSVVAIFQYNSTIEKNNSDVCSSHLQLIKGALDIYIMEHGVLPSSLAELRQTDIDKAYAQGGMKRYGWRLKVARFIADTQESGLAYASFIDDLAPGLRCPSAPAGTASYALNPLLAGISVDNYKQNLVVSAGGPIIFDAVANSYSYRHKKVGIGTITSYAHYITSAGIVAEAVASSGGGVHASLDGGGH
jgi:prepilin-type N-terminal cleavage/methylation domain-containing protein